MPRVIKRHKINDTVEEKQIATAFVVSDRFCRDMAELYEPRFIQVSYIRIICDWCFDYYRDYEMAPKDAMTEVYEKRIAEIQDEEEADLVTKFLVTISEDYEEKDNFNEQWYIDNGSGYFKKRSLQLLGEEVAKSAERGDTGGAEELINKHRRIERITSGWFDPLDDDEIKTTFEDMGTDRLFKMPGALGEMIGWFERGQLWGVMGPMKRGKSFWLQEFLMQAALNNLRVALITLEMKKTQTKTRLYRRVTGLVGDEGPTEFTYPVFDCLKNQDGSCRLNERTNKYRVIDDDGIVEEYRPGMKYSPCTACRGTKNHKQFIAEVWYKQTERERMTLKGAQSKLRLFKRVYKPRIRYKTYPSFSATIDDIQRDLDLLGTRLGFVPDMIAWDYPGITKSEKGKKPLDVMNELWMIGKGIAEERHSLVVAAHQGNRESIDQFTIKQRHTSTAISVLAHCDGFLTLNQTDEEKRRGLMRLGMMLAREQDFGMFTQATVLQSIGTGQTMLDSEFMKLNYEEDTDNE